MRERKREKAGVRSLARRVWLAASGLVGELGFGWLTDVGSRRAFPSPLHMRTWKGPAVEVRAAKGDRNGDECEGPAGVVHLRHLRSDDISTVLRLPLLQYPSLVCPPGATIHGTGRGARSTERGWCSIYCLFWPGLTWKGRL